MSRQEGETLIIPVLEEVLVVERRLRLKEEVRITRQQRTVHTPQSVVLKTYEVQVERFDENRDSGGTPAL
jgi:stress response protein YsnF